MISRMSGLQGQIPVKTLFATTGTWGTTVTLGVLYRQVSVKTLTLVNNVSLVDGLLCLITGI